MSVSADKKAEKRADKKAKSVFTCVPFMLKKSSALERRLYMELLHDVVGTYAVSAAAGGSNCNCDCKNGEHGQPGGRDCNCRCS